MSVKKSTTLFCCFYYYLIAFFSSKQTFEQGRSLHKMTNRRCVELLNTAREWDWQIRTSAKLRPTFSVIYGGGTAWFETQSLSGNLDLKIGLFHSKNHFKCTHAHTTVMYWVVVFLVVFFCSDFIMWGGGDCASLPSDWALIFIQVDMGSDVKSLTNRVLPWQRQRHRCLLSEHYERWALCFYGHSGTH